MTYDTPDEIIGGFPEPPRILRLDEPMPAPKFGPAIWYFRDLLDYVCGLKDAMKDRVDEVRAAGGEVGMDPLYLDLLWQWAELRETLDYGY